MQDNCECESTAREEPSDLDPRNGNHDGHGHECCGSGDPKTGINSENNEKQNVLVRQRHDVSRTEFETEKSSLVISEDALQKMCDIRSKDHRIDVSWHLALVRTHCMRGRGYAYNISIEPQAQSDQLLSQTETIQVYAPSSDISRLSGLELDYVETLQGDGFVVKNPNAKSKCPCGHHDIFD